ncbi:hypothetical protein RIU93_03805 [Staphylococcus warneri]|uniref:hypothetical protein n=1 Tax=Staphylococcus TaxID=1279 RepID=UPI0007372883|nr:MULTISPECIES: hypothetical protein [Staphylococcus]AXZ23733.1 hypothetical protein D3P10_08380 [Staphylococcus warneri]AXZ23798.1 hypothetical protein D3P10_08720 [Staphylococcus warneri]KTW08561.1 hypothetical protein NS346_04345 [Staphylococcus warneri]OIS40637.1 hypothetical protein A4A23_12200 [Staphylococcus warneri]OIS43710.1 hypothetical protein A4A24_01570 [Staphylococcus warneri]
MEFVQSTLFSNIIAVIALLVAIGSFVYTFMNNRPSIEISDYDVCELENENLIQFSFILANTSSKTTVVNGIRLIDSKGNQMEHIHVKTPKDEYLKYPNPSFSPYNSYVFKRPETFIPNAKLEFSYHLNEKPAKVEIITDKRIKGFSKNRKFNF